MGQVGENAVIEIWLAAASRSDSPLKKRKTKTVASKTIPKRLSHEEAFGTYFGRQLVDN